MPFINVSIKPPEPLPYTPQVPQLAAHLLLLSGGFLLKRHHYLDNFSCFSVRYIAALGLLLSSALKTAKPPTSALFWLSHVSCFCLGVEVLNIANKTVSVIPPLFPVGKISTLWNCFMDYMLVGNAVSHGVFCTTQLGCQLITESSSPIKTVAMTIMAYTITFYCVSGIPRVNQIVSVILFGRMSHYYAVS